MACLTELERMWSHVKVQSCHHPCFCIPLRLTYLTAAAARTKADAELWTNVQEQATQQQVPIAWQDPKAREEISARRPSRKLR